MKDLEANANDSGPSQPNQKLKTMTGPKSSQKLFGITEQQEEFEEQQHYQDEEEEVSPDRPVMNSVIASKSQLKTSQQTQLLQQ